MSQQYIADTTESIIFNGYKQTEIGIIPIDWNVVNIGSLCSIFGRIGFRGYTKADIVSEDQGAVSISPSNIVDGKVSWEKGTYISWRKYHESPEIKIYEEDILLVKTGSTYGKVGLVKNLKQEATLNPQVVVLKNRKCPSSLLAYLMQFELVQKQIGETIVGGAIPTLSQKEVANYLVPISPNYQEQTLIATALSDADALICELEKLIAKKQAIKTATMQQLLTGKTRLPQFALRDDGTRKGYKQSELGKVPEDWEICELKDAVDFLDGLRRPVRSSDRAKISGTYPYYGASGIVDYVKDFIFDDELILLGEDGENILSRNLPLVFKVSGKIWVNNHAHVMKPKSDFNIGYLTEFLESLDYSLLNSGTAQPKLNKQTCLKIKVAKPCKNEQTAITTILSDMDSEIQALEKRLNKTRQIKQGMMQELLTGKTRLVQPEARGV